MQNWKFVTFFLHSNVLIINWVIKYAVVVFVMIEKVVLKEEMMENKYNAVLARFEE